MVQADSNSSNAAAPSASPQRRRRLWRSVVLYALAGGALGAWLGNPLHPVTGTLIGAIVGSVCGTLDPVFDATIVWVAGRTRNCIAAGLAGGVAAILLIGAMMLAIMAGIGWTANCWG